MSLTQINAKFLADQQAGTGDLNPQRSEASIRSAVEQEIASWLTIGDMPDWLAEMDSLDRANIADAIASGAYRRKDGG